jgi:hypothetical protein
MDSGGENGFKSISEIRLPLSGIVTKCTPDVQLFVKNSGTRFHRNVKNSLIVDAKFHPDVDRHGRTDTRGLHIHDLV